MRLAALAKAAREHSPSDLIVRDTEDAIVVTFVKYQKELSALMGTEHPTGGSTGCAIMAEHLNDKLTECFSSSATVNPALACADAEAEARARYLAASENCEELRARLGR